MTEYDFTRRVQASERKLFRISYLMLRNASDGEDAVQETLLKAWRGKESLREDAFFETWLVRILINECKNTYKKRRPDLALDERVPAPPSPDPELYEAVQALPISLRAPIILKFVEGYGIREIAEILKLPQGTVSWRLGRAKQALKLLLKEETRG